MPPPLADTPPEMVRPVRLAVTPDSTVKTLKSVPSALLRATVRLATPVPAIDSGVAVLLSSRVPCVSVIVCGVAKVPAVSKMTVLGAGEATLAGLALVLTFAQPTAARRVPTSVVSAVLVTRYEELASYAPMSTVVPAFRPAGPRRAPRGR